MLKSQISASEYISIMFRKEYSALFNKSMNAWLVFFCSNGMPVFANVSKSVYICLFRCPWIKENIYLIAIPAYLHTRKTHSAIK